MSGSCGGNVSCGVNARCEENFCVCLEGYFVNEDFLSAGTKDCAGHTASLIAYYTGAVILYLLSLGLYGFFIERWSQFKRLIPFFIAVLIQLTFLLRKVTKVDKVFFGHDTTATVFMAVSWPLMYMGSHVFFMKYVTLHFKLLVVKPVDESFMLNLQNWAMRLANVAASISGALILSTLFEEDNQTARWKVSVGLVIFCAATHGICFGNLTEALRRDLKIVADKDPKFVEVIQRTKGVKYFGASIHGLFIVILVPVIAIPGDKGLEFYQYSFVGGCYIYCAACLGIIASNRLKFKKSSKDSPDSVNGSHARLVVSLENQNSLLPLQVPTDKLQTNRASEGSIDKKDISNSI